MKPVATRLLGEPNRRHSKPPKDVRWGNNGSLSVNFETGQFFDHEVGIGGGVVDLVRHKMGRPWRSYCLAATRGIAAEHPSRKDIPSESKPTGPKPRFVCAYDYVDEAGAMLHQTVRYDPKRFRQRQPHPEKHGEWIWNLEGIRTVLYQLPDLMKALANGDTIYVVEGEKDAASLRALGLPATCNPMGAGKWRPEFSDTLRGADAVVVADNDDPGRRHAQQVAESLYGLAKRVRVLDLAKAWPECPEKGDISDFIGAGGNADGISSLISHLAAWKPVGSWPEMPEEALYGLPGEVVRALDPHTEADPSAFSCSFSSWSAMPSVAGRTTRSRETGIILNSLEFSLGKQVKAGRAYPLDGFVRS
jgi:5S rRNA maturation endonuclease (ribonuclease M5)